MIKIYRGAPESTFRNRVELCLIFLAGFCSDWPIKQIYDFFHGTFKPLLVSCFIEIEKRTNGQEQASCGKPKMRVINFPSILYNIKKTITYLLFLH